jgi:hypothetical protein
MDHGVEAGNSFRGQGSPRFPMNLILASRPAMDQANYFKPAGFQRGQQRASNQARSTGHKNAGRVEGGHGANVAEQLREVDRYLVARRDSLVGFFLPGKTAAPRLNFLAGSLIARNVIIR